MQKRFPIEIEDNVYFNAFTSPKSYGASSYFIKRPEGNILIDSPRFTDELVQVFEEWGGIKYMFLTHKDDVADHQQYRDKFGCLRILGKADLSASIPEAEILVDNIYPFKLDDSEDSPLIIPSPGHTEGHLCMLYKDKFLFTGDHIAYSKSKNSLVVFTDYLQYSWPKLRESVERLIRYKFEWILPGHGSRIKANPGAFKFHLEKCLDWMDEQSLVKAN